MANERNDSLQWANWQGQLRTIAATFVATVLLFVILLGTSGYLEPAAHSAASNDSEYSISRATNLIAALAVLQLLIGGLGVALLYRTLAETRQTVKQASKATEAATRTALAAENAERAYLVPEFDLKIEDLERLRDSGPTSAREQVWITVYLHNVGRTPARDVQYRYFYDREVAGPGNASPAMPLFIGGGRREMIATIPFMISDIVVPEGESRPTASRHTSPYILVQEVSYRDIFTPQQTRHLFEPRQGITRWAGVNARLLCRGSETRQTLSQTRTGQQGNWEDVRDVFLDDKTYPEN